MVNIQSVILVSTTRTTDRTEIYASFEDFWTTYLSKESAEGRTTLQRYRHNLQIADKALADLHNLTEDQVRNLSFLFGGMIKTTRQLEDIELRDLITNLENKVILQVSRSAPGKVTNIISIHHKNGVTTLESKWERVRPAWNNLPAPSRLDARGRHQD